MERDTALNCLRDCLTQGTVSEKDKGFVESLVQSSVTRGLSEKQWYWVVKLAVRMTAKPAAVANFGRVYAMFAHAKQHLKAPKVVLNTGSGRVVKLYLSTMRSRVPNTVNVVDNEADLWFGRVYEDGKWEQGSASEGMQEVEFLLNQFAADPEGVAADYGRLHGLCCFCNRPLKDERSTAVGYGPVCADRFALKWGKK